jgi:hypothetical protein
MHGAAWYQNTVLLATVVRLCALSAIIALHSLSMIDCGVGRMMAVLCACLGGLGRALGGSPLTLPVAHILEDVWQ